MVFLIKKNFYTCRQKIINDMSKMDNFLHLKRTRHVHIKPEGEVCNRLKAGAKIYLQQTKGKWTSISWRNGKKRGWIKALS